LNSQRKPRISENLISFKTLGWWIQAPLIILAIILPWWYGESAFYVGWYNYEKRTDWLFLWGCMINIGDWTGWQVFSYRVSGFGIPQLDALLFILPGFVYSQIFPVFFVFILGFILTVYAMLHKSVNAYVAGSVFLLIASIIFYSVLNGLSNGNVIGSQTRDTYPRTISWGLHIGFYLSIICSLLGFLNVYILKRSTIDKVAKEE